MSGGPSLVRHLRYEACKRALKDDEGGTTPIEMRSLRISMSRVTATLAAGLPAVSVDAKKKELVGAYRIRGQGVAT